ncbi:MAG TPA: hypothetical protein VF690_15345, partial [Hymenobacter sp.]
MNKPFFLALAAVLSLASCQKEKEEIAPAAPQAKTATNNAHTGSNFVTTSPTTKLLTVYYNDRPGTYFQYHIGYAENAQQPNSWIAAGSTHLDTQSKWQYTATLTAGRQYYIKHWVNGNQSSMV